MEGEIDVEAARPRTPLYDAMLSEARERFAQQGYHGTSIREITTSAGSSEALLYRHFGSKRELYRRAVIDQLDEVIREYLGASGTSSRGPAWLRLSDEIGRLHDLFSRNAALMRSLAENSALKNDPAALITAAGSPLQPIFERVERLVAAALPGEQAGAVDVVVGARTSVGFVMAVTMFDEWLFDEHQPRPSREHAVEQVRQLILYGCTARPAGTVPQPAPEPAAPVPPAPEPSAVTLAGPSTRVRVQPEQRRRRSRHEVRRLILDAAREVFSEVGYEGAGTKAIAERAAVAETSVYRHFGTKRALFESAIFDRLDPWIAGYLDRWGASGRSTRSLEAQSRDYISATYDLLTADRALMRLAFGSLRDTDPDTQRSASPLHRNFARLEYQLARIAVDNRIRGIDPALVIRPTFGMLYALAALPEWMFGPDGPPSRKALIDEITAIMVYGFTARPTSTGALPPQAAER